MEPATPFPDALPGVSWLSPQPHPLVEILLSSKHSEPPLPPEGLLGASLVPGVGTLRTVPLRSPSGLSVSLVPSLRFLGFVDGQPALRSKAEAQGAVVGSLSFVCGPSGQEEQGAGGEEVGEARREGQGQTRRREPSRGPERERSVTLGVPTSRTCRLPAGFPMGLLGPCWVRWHCVQNSAPQVRRRGCRRDHQEWASWLRAQRQEGELVEGLKEGGLEPLPSPEEPGKPTSSP